MSGSRTIRADALYAGPLESTVRHDEIAVEAFFPALPPGEGVAFEELARRHGDYALCGVAAVVRVVGRPVVTARAGYLSVADVPTVVDLADPAGRGGRRRHARGCRVSWPSSSSTRPTTSTPPPPTAPSSCGC